ncbi:MAG: site-specific integrase [Rhodospirillaceae bacterium]
MLAADFDAAEREIGKAIADRRFGSVRETAVEILNSEGHTLSEGKQRLLELMLLQARQQNASFTAHIFRSGLGGALTWSPSDRLFQPEQRPAAMTVASDASAQIAHITFSEAVSRFIEEKRSSIGQSGVFKHEAQLKIAASHFGADTLVGTISRPQVRTFRDLLAKLPANFSKRFPSLSVAEIAALPAGERLPLLKPTARDPYIGSLSCLFKYCVKMGFASNNPATDMRFADPENARDKVLPFNGAQLTTIFSQPLFLGYDGCHWDVPGTTRTRDARYWLPLIALYTGMRRGEILALTRERLIFRNGVWLFDIAASKTNAGRRKVPVHSGLMQLGVIEFIQSQPERQPIFGGKTGNSLGKFFARFLDSCGLSDPKLNFHSFRHTFIQAARDSGVSVPDIQTLVGHAGNSQTTRTYGDPDNAVAARLLHDLMEQVRFGVSHAHLVPASP